MLHPVAQLGQHAVGDVERVLRDEVHAHALGAHQAHHQLDALDEHFRRLVEQQVGLVEEEHQFGLLGVADLGQLLEQLRQHPQEEGGIQARRVHELVGRQDVDHAVAVHRLHEVLDVEHGLAKELRAALLLNLQQPALDGAHAGGAHVAVFGGEFFGVVTHVLQHGAQVFEVQQQHAVVVGDLEHQVEHAQLGFIQVEHAAQQQRAHVRHRGAHRVALFAKYVPQRGGAGQGGGHGKAPLLEHCRQLVANLAGLAGAGQVALHVGHEHRHANAREVFGQGLQGHGLAGAGGAGDEPVAVGQAGKQVAFNLVVLGNQQGFGHFGFPRGYGFGKK
ncbi:hypothetical protein D3C71_1142140 [compost metagenome]